MVGEVSLIWDWNGTLLNDVEVALASMNTLLTRYNLPILSRSRYLEIFQFPVQSYYAAAGFDFEKVAFEQLANEFITEYYNRLGSSTLHGDVKKILSQFQARGYGQYILSAMEESALKKSVKSFGISKYFDKIYGIQDIFGKSKLERAFELFECEGLDPEESIMIGDSIHDYRLSLLIGCDHLLIGQGHQDFSRLYQVTTNLLNNIAEVPSYLFRFPPKKYNKRFLTGVYIN